MTANVLFAKFQLQIRNSIVAHTLVQMVYVIFSTDISKLVVVEIKLAMDIHHFVRHVVQSGQHPDAPLDGANFFYDIPRPCSQLLTRRWGSGFGGLCV